MIDRMKDLIWPDKNDPDPYPDSDTDCNNQESLSRQRRD